MTNHIDTDPTKAGLLAQKIVEILVNEDSVTRHRAIQAAMMLLGDAPPSQTNDQSKLLHVTPEFTDYGDLASFFNRDEDLKPSDYAQLCAAYHFSMYGTAVFSVGELRVIATEAGVVIPDRIDMTLNNATKKGKKLFQNAGKGSFRPTAAAGLIFGERWGVKPGRKMKTPSTAKENGV